MKKLLLLFSVVFAANFAEAQCTTTNATSCVCEDGSSECFLLPDITASWLGISNNGFDEYPQSGAGTNYFGQGPDDGRLRVSASTPNIGHGSFTVRGRDANNKRTFLCGNDTVYNVAATGTFGCPNGYPNPKQLLIQRLYYKNGNNMSYEDQYVGSMTYHPAHGHNHVDDWAVMTLRVQTSDPNPLNWPIVGTGAKIGFCLMDYGQCGYSGSTYDGHCRDDNTVYLGGNVLYNVDFPNWNLGGGNYNCSVVEQGISSGWTDVYGKHLDGMWINIPPTTCNGDYFIVLEIDKNNVFIEEDDSNNYTAVPVTLTQQLPQGTAVTPEITGSNSNNLCAGSHIELTATGGSSYLWSTGETTQTIDVTQAGSYTVEVTSYCGTYTSDPFVVNTISTPLPTTTGASICANETATITGSGTGTVTWYDDQAILVATGNSYTTPPLTTTTTYYAVNTVSFLDTLNCEPFNNGIGGGGYLNSEHYEEFDAWQPFTLKSVLVYSEIAENITIELQDSTGAVLQTGSFAVPAGMSTVVLDFNVPQEPKLRLVGKDIANNGGLYRNDNSASYPYSITDVVTIKGSDAGASYYYYFYNWEIHTTNSSCASGFQPVTVVVDPCASIGENTLFKQSINIAPNPNNGKFNVEFTTEYDGDLDFELVDMLGNRIFEESFEHNTGVNQWQFDEQGLASGMYLFNIFFEGKNYTSRIIIE